MPKSCSLLYFVCRILKWVTDDAVGKKQKKTFESIYMQYVNNTQWWNKLKSSVTINARIVASLRLTDRSNAPTLHLVARAFSDLKTDLRVIMELEIEDAMFGKFDQDCLDEVMKIVEAREKDCVSQLSKAAACVNPAYIYGTETKPNDRFDTTIYHSDLCDFVLKGFYNEKRFPLDWAKKQTDAENQFFSFVNKSFEWSNTEATILKAQTLEARLFFRNLQRYMPEFAPVAMMLCSQNSGNGAAERAHKITSKTFTKVCLLQFCFVLLFSLMVFRGRR
jgi:hypothetical protein